MAVIARGQTGIATAILAQFGDTNAPDFMTTGSVIDVLALANAWTMAPLVGFFILANIKTIPKRLYDLAAIAPAFPRLRQSARSDQGMSKPRIAS